MDIYKQKYEQALEYMRKVYPTLNGADKEDAEHYFPELKENEDERIREEIIAYLKDRDFDIEESWIPWLKKQGEQKPEIKYIYPKFRVGDVIEPAESNDHHHVPVRVKYIGEGAYSCDSDDRTAFLSLPICDENDYVLTKQKPAEWSEEDEVMMRTTKHAVFENDDCSDGTGNKVFEWLESIKKRMKGE